MTYVSFELGNRIEAVRTLERRGRIRRIDADKMIKGILAKYADGRDKEVFPPKPFAKVKK
jgi:hypothetical protein